MLKDKRTHRQAPKNTIRRVQASTESDGVFCYYSRTSIIRPSIIRIFNYPTLNPLSQLHLTLLF